MHSLPVGVRQRLEIPIGLHKLMNAMADAPALAPEVEAALVQWAKRTHCRLLVLFGSAAGGRAHAQSDLDIAAVFDPLPDPDRRLRMIGEIQDLCRRAVDLVFLRDDTNPVLRFEIFRRGRPIHEETAGLFRSEAVRALALYEDSLPFRKLLRERLILGAGGK